MKKQILILSVAMIAAISACGQEKHEHQAQNATSPAKTETSNVSGAAIEQNSASIKEIVKHYLELKNALVADNSKQAAEAGKALEIAFKGFDKSSISAEQKKNYEDIEDDAREHAEHIGANAGKIDHQREHFDMLSKDMYDLVKAFGAGQLLYKDNCPMYNDGKGAIWLSESRNIKNPYYGKKMLTCGSLKEEIK